MIHQAIVTLSTVLLAYELDRYSLDIGETRVLLDASPRFELSYWIEHFWEDEIARPYRKSTHQNTGYGQTMTNETFRFPMYTKEAVQSKRHERSNMKLANPGSTELPNPCDQSDTISFHALLSSPESELLAARVSESKQKAPHVILEDTLVYTKVRDSRPRKGQ